MNATQNVSNVSTVAPVTSLALAVNAAIDKKLVAQSAILATKDANMAETLPVVTSDPVEPVAISAAAQGKEKAAKAASAAVTLKGIQTVAEVIEAELTAVGGGNVFLALAKFGEASKLAGNPDRCGATLALVASQPDVYLAGMHKEVRTKILKYTDKAAKSSEYSRAKSAMAAGSVLTYCMDEVRRIARAEDEDFAGYARALAKLIPQARDARISLNQPVPTGWNGGGIDLRGAMASASATEQAAQATQTAKREASKAALATIAAVPAVQTAIPSAATTGTGLNHVGSQTPTGTVQAPAKGTNGTASPAPIALGPIAAPWIATIQGLEALVGQLAKQVPDAARTDVNLEIGLITRSITKIRDLCEARKPGAPVSPAAKLVKKDVK